MLDLPVYCRGNEAKDVSTLDLNNGLVDLTTRSGCEDSRDNNRPLHNKRTVGVMERLSHMAGNCSPVHMTSSLLLGSLSPYFSADDTIDGLLLPDVEEFVSFFFVTTKIFVFRVNLNQGTYGSRGDQSFCPGNGKSKKFYFISKKKKLM